MKDQYIIPAVGENDAEAIQKAVDTAAQTDLRTVVIPNTKIWSLDRTILLPSFVTVILDGAELHCDSVAFANANASTEASLATEQERIFILGTNGASIVGKNAPQIHFQNVKEFKIRGIRFLGGEGVKLSLCRYGKAQELKFSQSLHGVLLTEGCNNNLLSDILAETKREAVLWQGEEGGVWGRSNEIIDSSLDRLDAKTEG